MKKHRMCNTCAFSAALGHCMYIDRSDVVCPDVEIYEKARKEATDAACDWLIAHFNRTILSSGECVFEEKLFTTEIEEEFRKAMEEYKPKQ